MCVGGMCEGCVRDFLSLSLSLSLCVCVCVCVSAGRANHTPWVIFLESFFSLRARSLH